MTDSDAATPWKTNPDANDPPKPVGRFGTYAMVAYKMALMGLVIYLLAMLWPYPTPNLTTPAAAPTDSVVTAPDTTTGDTTAAQPPVVTPARPDTAAGDSTFIPSWLDCADGMRPEVARVHIERREFSSIPKCVRLFAWRVPLYDEQRLLYLVLLAGTLGALIHSLRSLASYIGNRKLMVSWVPYYILLPFGGAAIALVFYVVVRGGFSSPSTDFNETNPFGFIAVAALVGLFSQAAILKLQKIAENIFERPEPEKDSLKDKQDVKAGVISDLKRRAQVEGGREDIVDISGSDFVDSSKVEINGKPRLAVFEGAQKLSVTLEPAELAVLENGGELRFVVINGDKRSNEKVLQ